MKKLVLLLLILASALVISSCGGRNGGQAEDTTDGIVTTDDTSITEAVTTGAPVPTVPHVELTSRREQIGSSATSFKQLLYPLVTIEGNGSLADTINREIEAACANLFKRSVPGAAAMVRDGAEIEFTISDCKTYFLDGRYLSIAFFANIEVFGSGGDETPDRAYSTLNVDLQTGEVLYGNALISDLEKLKAGIASGKFDRISDGIEVSDTDIAEALVQYRVDYDMYPPVFFADDGATVCVELAKLQGGYVLFKIPNDTTDEYFTDVFSIE